MLELKGVEEKLLTREAEIAKQRAEQQKLASKNATLDAKTKELQRVYEWSKETKDGYGLVRRQ